MKSDQAAAPDETRIARLLAEMEAAATRDSGECYGPLTYFAQQLRAALAPPPTTWQPMETAPKDGSEILVFHNGYQSVVWWDDTDGWLVAAGLEVRHATHWMPLPDPPAIPSRAQE